MPQQTYPLDSLVPAFKALSDPTRLRLLNLLSEGEVCVCHLCDILKMDQPKISRHLAYLKRAGLVTARKDAQWQHYSWAEQTHPVAQRIMDELRAWMSVDKRMTKEREKLKQCCCR